MAFGIGALACRLDADLAVVPGVDPGEVGRIDWADFLAWPGATRPAFAGKYFVGSPWRWAHGEATSLIDPVRPGGTLKIAPLAAADAVRQAETGELGLRWGSEDGAAMVAALAGTARVGDLRAPADGPVFVYLEVAEALTGFYWAGWAAAISRGLMTDLPGAPLVPRVRQPFLPCLVVPYEEVSGSPGRWQLPAPIRTMLDQAGSLVTPSARCHGLWAITEDADPIVPAPTLDWSALTSYSQPQADGPPAPVPVRLWRFATGDQDAPVHGVGRFTLECTQADAGQPDPVLDGMLTAAPWTPTGPTVPTAIGVDRGDSLEFEMRCLCTTELVVGHLPEVSPHRVVGPSLIPPLKLPASFAARYYSAAPRADGRPPPLREKDLKPAEAKFLSRLGVDIVACFEARIEDPEIPGYLADPAHGYEDGKAAGRYAAQIIGQPAHQPIYFAVDCDVNPDWPARNRAQAITDAQLIAYFEGVKVGLDDAVQLVPKAVRRPYAVGAYACAHALDILYARGLASHFWQNYPPFWGDSEVGRPNSNLPANSNLPGWRHDNLWQVGMAYVPDVEASSKVKSCHKTFDLSYTKVPGPPSISFNVDPDGSGEQRTDVPFPPDMAHLGPWRDAAKAVAVQVKRFREHEVTLRFAYARLPVSARVEPLGLHPNDFHITIDETQQLADVNVAWGDTGGWRLAGGGR